MDRITSVERGMIDAAIAAGKVSRIPTGHTSVSTEYVWNPKIKRVVVANATPEQVVKKNSWAYRGGRTPSQAVMERKKKVLALVEEGLNTPQIAKKLGTTVVIIRGDIAAMRNAGLKVELASMKRKNEGNGKSAEVSSA